MLDERTPEREKYLLDQAAQYIVDHELGDFAQIILEGTQPFGEIVGELGFLMTYPLAVTFFSRSGADFINMFGFNYRGSSDQLLKRVAELKEIRELQQKQSQELEEPKGKQEGWFSRLKSSLRRLI
jgi:hypothetical protein